MASTEASASDDTNNDELVSNFMAFTGSNDPARAASYLEMSGGDLQTAVGLFVEHEHGGSDVRGGGSGGVGGGPAGRSRVGSRGAPPGALGGGGDAMGMDMDDIRAPDATRTMRLMDDQIMSADPTFHLMNAMMEEQLAQTAFASSSASASRFLSGSGRVDARAAVNAAAAASSASDSRGPDNDMEDNDYYDDEEKDDDDDDVQILPGGGGLTAPRLSDMFAAPNHLIHKAGGFAGARAVAKDSRRWLLVNIQRDSEFASHALNRDVWRDELVENLIREGFIFWQAMDQSPEGQTFVERYQVIDYPHISIIDPRTGRLLWRKEGWTQENPVTAETFAEMAMDFCSRNSFDRPPQAPRPPGSAPSSGGIGAALESAAAASRPSQKRPVQEMTEDEQLEAAMRASMQDIASTSSASAAAAGTNSDEATTEVIDLIGDGTAEDDSKLPSSSSSSKKKSSPSRHSLIDELVALPIGDEPAAGARLQFRMPDGKKVVRKFAPTDTVKMVYAYVAQSFDEARSGGGFSLMAGFPPSDLILDLEKSVDECKLAGQAITMRWKD